MALIDNAGIQAMYAQATRLRLAGGKRSQSLSESLCAGSQHWANYLAANGRLVHDKDVTEIIAMDRDHEADTIACFGIWMGSPPHKSILMGPDSHCGFGCARSFHGTFWVGRFGNDSSGPTDPTEPIPPVTPPPKPKPKWFDWLWWFLGSRRR